jgi:hypothetical protein
MWKSVIQVLNIVELEGSTSDQRAEACRLLDAMDSFRFVFILNMMIDLMGITNDLSQAIQRKDQDILNAMDLVLVAKLRLQKARDSDFESLWAKVTAFCNVHDIEVLQLDDEHQATGRGRRRTQACTNRHLFQVELYNAAIDAQLSELSYRFSDDAVQMLRLAASLMPSDNFKAFDVVNLTELASQFYSDDFSDFEIISLGHQLENFVQDARSHPSLSGLVCLTDLSRSLIITGKAQIYPLVYRLVRLVLTLPVATATGERFFSAMKIIKTRLRTRMGADYLKDAMLLMVEKELADTVTNEEIMTYFQEMANRRCPIK